MSASLPPTTSKSRTYGHIPGVPAGTIFESRREAFTAGVHGHIRKGIHGDPTRGAFSICMSGGYEDNRDSGSRIIYVGSGGRAENGKQIWHQSFEDIGNKSLHRSWETQRPVRLIRGKDEHNPYAPISGYRYDGLYVVDSATKGKGIAGYNMCFFELSRIEEGDNPTD